jgi:hypothetical protein
MIELIVFEQAISVTLGFRGTYTSHPVLTKEREKFSGLKKMYNVFKWYQKVTT